MRQPRPLRIGASTFVWGRKTFIMAILNVTPDSFAGGFGPDVDAAVERGVRDVADGADILDIGGESTRPGGSPVDVETELARVLPVITRLASLVAAPISIDTTKAAVARAALLAGASLVNDVRGLRGDAAMAGVVRERGVPVVAMANLRGIAYDDVLAATARQFQQSLSIAAAAGVPRSRVILDPGFGFGPPPQENLLLLRRLRRLRRFGRPLLVGTSRKSTIGRVLGLPVEERLEGTAATVALAIANGADIVRVHDVRAMARVAQMADAVVRGWPEPTASADRRAGR